MNIYSELIKKVQKNKKIAFLDIDLTFTGKPEIQNKTRTFLEEKGYAVVFVTSRPYELVLSDESLGKSETLFRPPSKTETDADGNHFHKNLAEISSFSGLLDADVIASSTGLEIYLKQITGEYLKDETFNVFPFSSEEWKNDVLSLLETFDDQNLFSLKPIDNIHNYLNNVVDIAPIDYRLQLDFKTPQDKENFVKEFEPIEKNLPMFLLDDSEPEFNKFSLYIFPKKADSLKAEAVDFILENVTRHAGLSEFQAAGERNSASKILKGVQDDNRIKTLVAGDSYPDLAMILYSANNAHGTFYVAGGSRLNKCFTDNSVKKYLDIPIGSWKKNLQKKKPGIYSFKDRTIYVGDELFPGLKGVESLLQFLQSSDI